MQALANASRSATRVHQTRTPTDGSAIIIVLVDSALHHNLTGCVGDPESCRRIIMSTKPSLPLFSETPPYSLIKKQSRGACIVLTGFIVCQQDEYQYPYPYRII